MEDNCFTALCWCLPYFSLNQPQAHLCPLPLEPPSHLSPHPTPLACLRALGLSWLNHTENSHWLSVLHMVICMFSCYPLNLSHPLLSPWRRPWHPTLVLLPGKSHGRRSLGGAVVHGVAKSQTGLSDFTLTFHFHALEKEVAAHSSVLAWRIPGAGEPGGLPSMGSHRVGHD